MSLLKGDLYVEVRCANVLDLFI